MAAEGLYSPIGDIDPNNAKAARRGENPTAFPARGAGSGGFPRRRVPAGAARGAAPIDAGAALRSNRDGSRAALVRWSRACRPEVPLHFPVVFTLGPLRLPAHALFESLGYALGYALYRALRRRQGDAIPETTRWIVVAAAAAGALAGSRLLFWLQNPALLRGGTPAATLLEGKTIVGGLLGGLIAVELAKRRLGETRSTGDLFVLPLCLGMAVGRVGCFLAGLADPTYGGPTTLPWGVDLGDGVARHPVQLYEIGALALIAAWAVARRPRAVRPGDIFRGFLALYLAFRLGLEFLKPNPKAWLGLSAIQIAALAGLAYYLRDLKRVFIQRGAATPCPTGSVPTSSTTAR